LCFVAFWPRASLQVEFFQLAVEHGCADAFGELSLCYQYSKGVKCNDRVAFELALQVRRSPENRKSR
jgi:hypothetical protein